MISTSRFLYTKYQYITSAGLTFCQASSPQAHVRMLKNYNIRNLVITNIFY